MTTLRPTTALLVALAAAPLALAAPAGAQPSAVEYEVAPAPGSSRSARGDYFAVEAKPGTELTQSLFLRNDSRRPLTLRLSPVDAVSAQFGGVAYGAHTRRATRVGAWLALGSRSVRLPPQASRIVRFTIAVPPTARPGVHVAGIAVWSPAHVQAQTPPPSAATQARAAVVVTTRRVIAVVVRLPGPAAPRLAVTGVEPIARPDGVYLEIGLANLGSALTRATGTISLPDEGFERDFEVDTFVPGTTIAYPIKWRQRAADGEYDVAIDLRYGSRTASWNGSFSVGSELVGELEDRGLAPAVDSTSSSARSLLLVAVASAAGALAVTGLVAVALRSLRRRHSGRALAAAAPGGDDAP